MQDVADAVIISGGINGLATAIATRHRDDAIDAFARISRVHAEDPDVLTGDR